MHDSSYQKMVLFSEIYLKNFTNDPLRILDFGSQSVDDSPVVLRNIFSTDKWSYIGADIVPGPNVDLVIKDPYSWTEIDSNSIDLIVSGQTFEHIDFFWVTMFEIGRVLKPGGVAVLIAPSGGFEHRYPVDCWRFYRDGFAALSRMIHFKLLESFTDWGRSGDEVWADTLGVFQKPIWNDEEQKIFTRKYLAAQSLLPLEINSLELSVNGTNPQASILRGIGDGRLTPILEKIRLESINQDPPIALRIRQALGMILERKNVSRINQLLGRTPMKAENSWGTNTNILSD
jgi:SAM-dependent methyltransferase